MTENSIYFPQLIRSRDMPKEFKEGNLSFSFSDDWLVEKYDEHPFVRDKVLKLRYTKAIDFIASDPNGIPFFIEVTDYRGNTIQYKQMLKTDAIALETATKVKDSIAGIIGCHRNYPDPVVFTTIANKLLDPDVSIRVILWLECDVFRNEKDWKTHATTLADTMKRYLKWLTKRILVVNQRSDLSSIPELRVQNLARSGRS